MGVAAIGYAHYHIMENNMRYVFIICLLISMFCVGSCSTSPSNSQKSFTDFFYNDLFSPKKHDFAIMVLQGTDEHGLPVHYIMGTDFINMRVTYDFTLKINNVLWDNDSRGYNFIQGETYKFEATFKGKTTTANLTIPNNLSMTHNPLDFHQAADYRMEWSLRPDTDTQYLYVLYSQNNKENLKLYSKPLPVGIREYVLKANTIQTNNAVLYTSVYSLNHVAVDRHLFLAYNFEYTHGDLPTQVEGPVAISIYDIRGNKIRYMLFEASFGFTNIDGITWNGLDDNGNPVGSGIYFYNLKANGINITTRMALMMY